tara:strand:- start:418 stop:690 length:273 start_codon:yes stop_codon:yes gene_type:complete
LLGFGGSTFDCLNFYIEEIRMVKAASEPEDSVVVPYAEFRDKKIDQYVLLWKYGKHSDEQFHTNMCRMGYEEEDVEKCIKEYNNMPYEEE